MAFHHLYSDEPLAQYFKDFRRFHGGGLVKSSSKSTLAGDKTLTTRNLWKRNILFRWDLRSSTSIGLFVCQTTPATMPFRRYGRAYCNSPNLSMHPGFRNFPHCESTGLREHSPCSHQLAAQGLFDGIRHWPSFVEVRISLHSHFFNAKLFG
jgi:hypothetical protein